MNSINKLPWLLLSQRYGVGAAGSSQSGDLPHVLQRMQTGPEKLKIYDSSISFERIFIENSAASLHP